MDYTFTTYKRGNWISDIVNLRNLLNKSITQLHICLENKITRKVFEPYHFVTLSCLIGYAKSLGIKTWLLCKDNELQNFIFEDARIREYITNSIPQVFHSPENNHFNLWKIDNVYYTNYCIALNKFFENTYFNGKDLSGLNNCITELIQNVIDHSGCDNNSFFCISYEEQKQNINLAICDFGMGIAKSLTQFSDDEQALKMCLKRGISANTQKHNQGLGMDNIISTMAQYDAMRIISNRAMLFKSAKDELTFRLDFEFVGTLIYMSININSFEDIEILEQLTF